MDAQAFVKAVSHIVEEKNIPEEIVWEAIELALTTAYKKNFNALTNVRVDINRETGEIKVLSLKTVVAEYEDKEQEILLADAKKNNSKIKLGEVIEEEVTPKDFGRVATSTAKQVVTQKIREAERDSIMNEFTDKQDELVVGIASREDAVNYYIDLGRAHGILPKAEILPNEKITMGGSLKVYITKIENTAKGPRILLSRTHYGFVKRLLELEIPELQEGIVALYSVAREAGNRSKIAVYSSNEKVDPIGACIGEKGERINRITDELKGEKVDVILYDKDPVKFIENALSPAKDVKVYIMDPKNQMALAIASGDNLSLAIGKKGQNVRLAARLTRYKIDVKTSEQAKEEGIKLNQFEGSD
jgi:transcription termination/antitermination protein NusA